MSYESGMAAIRLEMTDCIPRTEYSASGHWALVSHVTGRQVDPESDAMERLEAARAFVEAWDYALTWDTVINGDDLHAKRSKMGHAVFADGGVDFDGNIHTAFSEPEEVYSLDLDTVFGPIDIPAAINRFNQRYKLLSRIYPETVATTGIYITAMSGFLEMLGWDMLLYAAGYDYKAFCRYANRYSRWVSGYFEALADSDVPVVMIHDDLVWANGPFIRMDFYRDVVLPNIKRQLAPIRESGKKILFTCDGNFTALMDDIADCGVNGFCMEPLTDLSYAVEKYGNTHTLIGNADTRVLLTGDKNDICREVKRCMDLGRNCPGFMMAVGNHIPANTPVENAMYYNECYNQFKRR